MRTVFVTVTYPPPWTIPHPDPPLDQEASSSTTFHRKWHSPGLAPGTFSLDTQDTPAVSGACVGRLRQSSQALLPRTILAPGRVSGLPFFPSFSLVPLRPQRAIVPGKRQRRSSFSFQAPRWAVQSSGARWGPPFLHFQATAALKAACPHILSLLQAVVQVPFSLSAQ